MALLKLSTDDSIDGETMSASERAPMGMVYEFTIE